MDTVIANSTRFTYLTLLGIKYCIVDQDYALNFFVIAVEQTIYHNMINISETGTTIMYLVSLTGHPTNLEMHMYMHVHAFTT